MSLLSVRDLTLQFGGLIAVNKVNFDIKQGEIMALIGPNGAGKTSVFNAITGVYEPTSGNVLLENKDLSLPWSARTTVGFTIIALLSGLGFFVALHTEELWEHTITANYVYQAAFPWGKAIGDLFGYSGGLPWTSSFVPFLFAAAIAVAGAYTVWRRSRRTPEVITKSGIARTFQNIRLFQQMTVLDNVLVGMHCQLCSHALHAALRLPFFWKERSNAVECAEDLLRFVDLYDRRHALASSLPYGSQRRLEIGRALASKPKLLLLDEPAAGMNPTESSELMALIKKIRESGVTVMLIEHHMKVVMGISDRIVVLDYGNKIAEGTPDEIKKNAKVIEAYLGQEGAA